MRFLAGFGLLLGAYYVIILLPWADRALLAYLEINARLANGLLHLAGQDTLVQDATIRSADFAVSVRRGCDAVEPAWFFTAAVLAFPQPWRAKLPALLLGATAILSLNIVRIASLFLIGRWQPRFFATAHLEVWPAVFILLAVALWLGWIRLTLARPRPAAHATT